jgi:hypothetical protein
MEMGQHFVLEGVKAWQTKEEIFLEQITRSCS